jgi:hypothetical protein
MVTSCEGVEPGRMVNTPTPSVWMLTRAVEKMNSGMARTLTLPNSTPGLVLLDLNRKNTGRFCYCLI